MTDTLKLVKEFHIAFGHPIAKTPALIDMNRANMRVSLIKEETEELVNAILEGNLVEVADALADLKYVTDGMALEYGIPLNRCSEEVHRSNMTKLGLDGKPIYREDGKILKGESFEEPNLSEILKCK